jgi:hypothetical protein
MNVEGERREAFRGLILSRHRWVRAGRIGTGLCQALCIGLLPLLLCFGLDNLIALPAGLRAPLSLLLLGGCLIPLILRVLRPLLKRPSLEHRARELEIHLKRNDNLFITHLQLGDRKEARPWIESSLEGGGRTLREAPTTILIEWKRLQKHLALVSGTLLLALLYLTLFPQAVDNAWNRFSRPLDDIPPLGQVDIEILPSGPIHAIAGDDVTLTVKIRHRGGGTTAAPPILVWQSGSAFLSPSRSQGQEAALTPIPKAENHFSLTWPRLENELSFRVFCGGTYSPSQRVYLAPLPTIQEGRFTLTPPSYTEQPPRELPGPPASLSGLKGSQAILRIRLDRPVTQVSLQVADTQTPLQKVEGSWSCPFQLNATTPYRLLCVDQATQRQVLLAEGNLSLTEDPGPTVRLLSTSRNRFVNPGTRIELPIEAEDDCGVRSLALALSPLTVKGDSEVLKEWRYRRALSTHLKERTTLHLDPVRFKPGASLRLHARARDHAPQGRWSESRPLILRIRTLDQVQLPQGHALAPAFAQLKATLIKQQKALAGTKSTKLHRITLGAEGRSVAARNTLGSQQTEAQQQGRKAIAAFAKEAGGETLGRKLNTLVNGEMRWVLDHIQTLGKSLEEKRLASIEARQTYLVQQLTALLGTFADQARQDFAKAEGEEGRENAPLPTEDAVRELADDLKEFAKDQKKILERSRTLLDQGPEDLSDEEEEILGELAREEAKWATFLEEKLTDFAKLPQQDFADGSIAEEFNEVFQEIKLAEKSLYEKTVELAVPHEQSGLESAEELIQNLEKWLPDTPDNLQWSMEEPETPPDVPLAELPAELEDIVGELLDSEEAMAEDVEDMTSSWMDSIDKGAGWDAKDGPISSMSAKGVTGNQLPNEMEIGGRSGEGRQGRSHGQMVEDTAEGKGGRETPTRLTPSPFEEGSIEDASTESGGGSTGGGKLSGSAGEGLRGPVPPQLKQQMKRMAGQQAQLRQKAETLSLALKKRALPSGDIDVSIRRMQAMEKAAAAGNPLALRQAQSRIVEALTQARSSIKGERRVRREHLGLSKDDQATITHSLGETPPKGYEEMTREYFKALTKE